MNENTSAYPGVPRRQRQMAYDVGNLLGLPLIRGRYYWVDPTSGAAGNNGKRQKLASESLETIYSSLTSGAGDGVVLLSAGTTAAGTTSYLDAAITWSKHGITVFGVSAGNNMYQRSRVANRTTVTDIVALLTISGNNNRFENVSFFNSGTDAAATGGVIVTGARNAFINCHFVGGSCTTATANERSLELGDGAQENYFYRCVIGTDTIDRGNNANCELLINGTTSGTARNYFKECLFLGMSSTAGGAHLAIKSAAATSMGRNMIMENCIFDCYIPNEGAGQASLFGGTAFNTAHIILANPTVHGYADLDSGTTTSIYTNYPAANAAGGIVTAG